MATVTVTPNGAARTISAALKRQVTPKAVRTMARSIIARLDKTRHPEYQSHEYSAAEVKVLQAAFAARGQRSKAQPKRPSKAQRTKTRASKAPSTEVTS